MHKISYVSGFLYNADTEQILLQQSKDTSESPWTLFSIESEEETMNEKLLSHLNDLLRIKIHPTHIHSIYKYENKEPDGERFISFIELPKFQEFTPHKNTNFGWFSRKQIVKARLDSQIRQDITVGLRVIDAMLRKSLGQHTLL